MVLVSVRYSFYQPVDEKIRTWTLHFPAKNNHDALFKYADDSTIIAPVWKEVDSVSYTHLTLPTNREV